MVELRCLYCNSDKVQKKGDVQNGVQKFCCGGCNNEFIIRGINEEEPTTAADELADVNVADGIMELNLNCVHCESDNVQKNGKLKGDGQRYKCLDCRRHFTKGGIRGTYNDEFKEQIADFYVHRKISARKLARKYGLSTSTIVTRGKQYKANYLKTNKGT